MTTNETIQSSGLEVKPKFIEDLANKAQELGVILVGLNDSQGTNLSSFVGKSSFDYISEALGCESISAFDLTFNKLKHIPQLLDADLSKEELRALQAVSTSYALRKGAQELYHAGFVGSLGAKIINARKSGEKDDDEVHITTAIREAKRPVIILSSGANDYMQRLGSNPWKIKKDYKQKHDKEDFNYAIEMAKNPNTIETVMKDYVGSIEALREVNPNAIIIAMGMYTPDIFKKGEMKPFAQLIANGNERIIDKCDDLGLHYVDIESLIKGEIKGAARFHATKKGHTKIAAGMLNVLYDVLVDQEQPKLLKPVTHIIRGGFQGMIASTRQRLNSITTTLDACQTVDSHEKAQTTESRRIQILGNKADELKNDISLILKAQSITARCYR